MGNNSKETLLEVKNLSIQFKSEEGLVLAVNKMNSEYYRSGLRVTKLVEFFEIEPILHTYGIETY